LGFSASVDSVIASLGEMGLEGIIEELIRRKRPVEPANAGWRSKIEKPKCLRGNDFDHDMLHAVLTFAIGIGYYLLVELNAGEHSKTPSDQSLIIGVARRQKLIIIL
jgi:hypothetical protein